MHACQDIACEDAGTRCGTAPLTGRARAACGTRAGRATLPASPGSAARRTVRPRQQPRWPLLPQRHVRAAQAVRERPADAQQLGTGGVPCVRVAGVEHRLPHEVLPADEAGAAVMPAAARLPMAQPDTCRQSRALTLPLRNRECCSAYKLKECAGVHTLFQRHVTRLLMHGRTVMQAWRAACKATGQ